jgi:hypothetical protein
MSTVVIKVVHGIAEVAYQSEETSVTIVRMGSGDLYLYQNYICEISAVNDDGTLNLKCVDTLDGRINNANLLNIPADDVSFFALGEDSDLDDEDDNWDDGEDE